MNAITDIKIVSIDQEKPPLVRKEAYIDLFFKLSHQASNEWCEDFNKLGHQMNPPVKINNVKGLVVETWVREMNHIQDHLNKIKVKITLCNEQLLAKITQRNIALAASNASAAGTGNEQAKLNHIIAELDFSLE